MRTYPTITFVHDRVAPPSDLRNKRGARGDKSGWVRGGYGGPCWDRGGTYILSELVIVLKAQHTAAATPRERRGGLGEVLCDSLPQGASLDR